MKKPKAAVVDESMSANSTLIDNGRVPIEIEGRTYYMSFVFSDLCKAESNFNRQGHRPELLFNLPQLNLESIRACFPCLIFTHHPELTWEQAQALVTLTSAYAIATSVNEAFNRAGGRSAEQVAAE